MHVFGLSVVYDINSASYKLGINIIQHPLLTDSPTFTKQLYN